MTVNMLLKTSASIQLDVTCEGFKISLNQLTNRTQITPFKKKS